MTIAMWRVVPKTVSISAVETCILVIFTVNFWSQSILMWSMLHFDLLKTFTN